MNTRTIPEHLLPIEKNPILRPIFFRPPTVRILFYTDSGNVTMSPSADFGVNHLRDLLLDEENPFYVNFEIELLNRHAGGHANNKLTSELLANYDEVWFFGVLQSNLNGVSPQPENELTSAEVDALAGWMARGGVLMTGDHANPRPENATAGSAFLNLGRALGYKVPRAGELRKWEGPPTSTPPNNYNTQEPNPSFAIDSLGPQSDKQPQRLELRRELIGRGVFTRTYRPHPLFCGWDGPIDIFPDHMHEGEVLDLPVSALGTQWPVLPSGTRLAPQVVAWGRDKRPGFEDRRYNIVSAYDGDRVGVGRIVADSTWHHYFNVNLRGFLPPAEADTKRKIRNFFFNLAVWLAPKTKRTQMRLAGLIFLAAHPLVLEVKGSPLSFLGRTALDVLGRNASQCEITRFSIPDLPILIENPLWPIPPEELTLGAILREYHKALEEAEVGQVPPPAARMADAGFKLAVRVQREEVEQGLKLARLLEEEAERMLPNLKE